MSGAGDTVISVVSMLINDIDIEEIAKISNIAGGIVCDVGCRRSSGQLRSPDSVERCRHPFAERIDVQHGSG